MVAPISGRSPPSCGTRACAIPAIAPAAFVRIWAEIWLMPAMSTTEYIIVTSTAPTYGRVSPDASVETISLGTPTGRSRIACAAIDELPEPPTAATPSSRPSACSRASTEAAPLPMAATAPPGPPARASSEWSAPPARATSSRDTSASTCGSPSTPQSTSSTSAPASRTRPRRKPYSIPLVSSVPTRTTVAISGSARPYVRRQVVAGAEAWRRAHVRAGPLGVLHAEEAALQLRVGGELGRRRLGEDAPGDHHQLALGHRGRHGQVLLDHEDRQAVAREPLERLDQHLDDRRREPLGRLVHDQEPRVGEQRAADREHLLLAAGELHPAVPAPLGQTWEQLVHGIRRPALIAAPRRRHPQVLVDGQRREQPPPLRHVADASAGHLVGRAPDQLLPVELDGPGRVRRADLHDRVAQ